MKNIKASAVAEGAVIAALTVLLLVLALYLPLFSIFSLFFAGIPIAYLTIKHPPGIAVLSALAALLVLFIITGNIVSVIMMGVVQLLPGLVLGFCFLKNTSFYKTLGFVSITVAAGMLLDLLIINFSAGGHGIEDMINSILQSIEQMLVSFADKMQAMNADTGQDLHSAVKDLVSIAETMIRTFIPTFVIIVSMCTGYIIYMASVFILHRVDRNFKIDYVPFSNLKAPKSMCYTVILLFLVVTFTSSEDVLTAALSNMVVIMYFFIGVCGLSFLDAKLKNKISSGYLRFTIYAGIFLFGYFFISFIGNVLILIGLADGVMDFRHIKKRGEGHVDGK